VITNISDEDIKTELRAGRKVEAIKVYRQRQGVGLKHAKDAVEAIDAGVGHARTVG
jgi:large subunit ribosomal protein L7/L12